MTLTDVSILSFWLLPISLTFLPFGFRHSFRGRFAEDQSLSEKLVFQNYSESDETRFGGFLVTN